MFVATANMFTYPDKWRQLAGCETNTARAFFCALPVTGEPNNQTKPKSPNTTKEYRIPQ